MMKLVVLNYLKVVSLRNKFVVLDKGQT